jgi:lipoate-protein ligase A
MERDRALWRRFEADPSPGIRLRVYGWSPPAISLGFHQPDDGVDRVALRERGFDLVRRPTGGAAVLHADELTYAVAGPLGLAGIGRSVLEIHHSIAGALARTLSGYGIDVDFGGGGTPRDFACFSGAGGHEITVGGRKLVGSALRRGRHAFLQHGSILCGEGHLDLVECMSGLDAGAALRERARLADRTCSLSAISPRRVTGPDLAARFAAEIGRVATMSVVAASDFTALLAARIP